MTTALPVTLHTDETITTPSLRILPGGRAEVTWRGWGYTRGDLNCLIREMIRDYFICQLEPDPYYWRATDNQHEIKLIKAGELSPSLNHAENRQERGLSVTDHLGYIMTAGYHYGYRVQGEVIGYGSDGEPLLDIATLKPLDRKPRSAAEIEAKEGKAAKAKLLAVIEAASWTWDDYLAASFAYVPYDN